jgi:ATP-dependent DNA ligase
MGDESPDQAVPFPPMEAELVRELPDGDGWQYEPKWDGFRGVLENVGGGLRLWSRNGRPLLRYFPELEPLGELLPPNSALDGEIVIQHDGMLDFDAMQTRLHPAESRIRRLSTEIPAQFVAFDVLLWRGEPLWDRPLAERRSALETLAAGFTLSPATRDRSTALRWLDQFEVAGLDGVIAKRVELPYAPGSRQAVVKVKPQKTADCVVVGFRRKAGGEQIATLLLGIYNEEGELDYVGSAAVAPKAAAEFAARLEPLLVDAPERRFSEPNRWTGKAGGGLEEFAIRPELVCEVRYDKVQGRRFRHGTRFLRWRHDKDAAACTWDSVLPRRRPGDATVDDLLGRR